MVSEKNTIRRLSELPILFRKPDAEKVAPHTAAFLSRALQKGLVHRLSRGNYVNSLLKGFPAIEEVACFLKPPAYISCEWALNRHGIIIQAPAVCTVVTLSGSVGRAKDVEYQGITLEFSRIAPALFFGFVRHETFWIAGAEKALLDTLYLHKTIPAGDEMETDLLDPETLWRMAEKYPASVSRRLSEILTYPSTY